MSEVTSCCLGPRSNNNGAGRQPFVRKSLGSHMKLLHDRRPSLAAVTPGNSISKHTAYAVPKTLIAFSIAGILSTAAHAQTAPRTAAADESEKQEMTEVVVTGTMIKRVNAETAE